MNEIKWKANDFWGRPWTFLGTTLLAKWLNIVSFNVEQSFKVKQKYVIEYKCSWGEKLIASCKLDIKKEPEQCLTLCRTQGILMTSQKCQHVLLFCVRCLLQYYRMRSFLEGWTSFKFSEVDGQVKQTAPAQTLCTPIAKGQNFLLSWDVFSSKR